MASDENYVSHMETLIVSIGETNRSNKINIYILDGGMKNDSRENIFKFEKIYTNISIKFIKMTEEIIYNMLDCEVKRDRSLSTYARIFIPELISDKKAIYLDVDGVVLSDLQKIYDMDLEGKAIAGVRDTNPIIRHRNVGLRDSDIYINAGFILWNLEKCREINFVDLCKQFIRDRNGNIDAMDQGTINGVLGRLDLIKVIAPRYNAFTSLFQLNKKSIERIYGLSEYYSDLEINEARKFPVFVHFTPNMTTRPWIEHCVHPLKEDYWKYRQKTHFPKKMYQKDTRNIYRRILGWVYRTFPQLLYVNSIQLNKREDDN